MDPRITEFPTGKRRHVRFAFNARAEIVVAASAGAFRCTMLDLSKEGCLLVLAEPGEIAAGTRIEVLFHLNRQAFRVNGTVRTQRSDNRLAIQFDRLDPGIGRQLGTLSSIRSQGRENRNEEQPAADPPVSPTDLAKTGK